MIELKFTANSYDELLGELKSYLEQATQNVKATKKKTTRKKKATKEDTPSENVMEDVSPVEAEVVEDESVSEEDTYKALQDLSEKKGIDAARKALETFKAPRLSALKEEDYTAFVTTCMQMAEA